LGEPYSLEKFGSNSWSLGELKTRWANLRLVGRTYSPRSWLVGKSETHWTRIASFAYIYF